MLDSRWQIICKRVFPSCNFIDGADASLPTVDILLMNRIALHACSITLDSVPFSLVLTTRQNGPIHRDWNKMTWKLPHTHVGGDTTGGYKLYSWHLITYYFPPSIILLPALPASNIHRVIDKTVSSGIVGSVPPLTFKAGEELFPIEEPSKLFTVRCIYSAT